MASELETLRDAIVARLESELVGVPILSRKTGDLQNQIDRELGKLGLVVIVSVHGFAPKGQQSSVVIFDPVSVSVIITEDPLLHTSEPHAAEVAQKAAIALHNWRADFDGAHLLLSEDPGYSEFPVPRGEGADASEDLIGWSGFYRTKLALRTA